MGFGGLEIGITGVNFSEQLSIFNKNQMAGFMRYILTTPGMKLGYILLWC